MSLSVVSASSQYLLNSTPPFVSPPFTIGAWVMPATTSANLRVFGMADPTLNTNSFQFGIQLTTNSWNIATNNAGVTTSGNAGTPVAGSWHYVLGRFISPTNRWVSVINPDGSYSHGQDTVSGIPPGLTNWSIGALGRLSNFQAWNGYIAEFFITNSDIQADGGQISEPILHQLAHLGPLSIPHIKSNIVEYHSLRTVPTIFGEHFNEDYYGQYGKQNWTVVNGIAQAEHVPYLYSGYEPTSSITQIIDM